LKQGGGRGKTCTEHKALVKTEPSETGDRRGSKTGEGENGKISGTKGEILGVERNKLEELG